MRINFKLGDMVQLKSSNTGTSDVDYRLLLHFRQTTNTIRWKQQATSNKQQATSNKQQATIETSTTNATNQNNTHLSASLIKFYDFLHESVVFTSCHYLKKSRRKSGMPRRKDNNYWSVDVAAECNLFHEKGLKPIGRRRSLGCANHVLKDSRPDIRSNSMSVNIILQAPNLDCYYRILVP